MSATIVGLTLARSEKFWANVVKSDGCWAWTGSVIKKDGRGTFHLGPRSIVAPRASWIIAYGQDVPEGRMVCHSCDNPNCVRPDHLWIGTNAQNLQDAGRKKRLPNQQRENCIHGHPLSGENLIIHKGWRQCRTCYQTWRRNYWQRQRECQEIQNV